MSTTANLPQAPAAPPNDSLPQQQQFDTAAKSFNTVYTLEQNEVAQLQSDVANMSTWGQLLEFLGALASLSQLMTACKVTSDECAESVAGLLQGAEGIFSNGVEYVNDLSQSVWATCVANDTIDSGADQGVPVPSISTLNSTYATQVAQANLLVNYLQDIYWDVSGYEFTAVGVNGQTVNPLSGIEVGLQEATQDIAYQMVCTYNEMYNGLNGDSSSLGGLYTPSSSSSSEAGTYSQEYSSEINDPTGAPPPNDLFDMTGSIDTGNTNNPMSNPTSAGDIVCYAMLNWFYIYATPVQYTGFTPTSEVFAPTMTQNQSAYQVENDFATINSSSTGFAPQSMPVIGFLTNLTSNALAAIGNFYRDTATLSQTIISNTNG